MGIRASNTTELIFDNCFVPVEDRLGREGSGFRIAMATLDAARPFVGAVSVGIAEAAFRACCEYAKVRVQFGKPIASFQMVQAMIADMAMKVEGARLLVHRACWMKDQAWTSAAKLRLLSATLPTSLCRLRPMLFRSWAATATSRNTPVEKYMRDAKIMQIYEGTNQIQRLVIANKTLY